LSRAATPILTLLVLLASALPAAAKDSEAPVLPENGTVVPGEVVPGEVVVKWRDAGRGPQAIAAHGLAVVAELGAPGKGLPALVSTEGRPVDEVLAELRADPAVEYAEPNYLFGLAEDGATAAVSVTDPKSPPQYSLDRMRVRDAWSLSTGGSRVVAVLDTGVEFGHQDLAGRLLQGYDFVNDDLWAGDDNGHGTWVSGIIAANTNNGIGIAGISWSDKVLPVKIMSAAGTGNTSDLTSGIVWATDHGASVINMSVGGFPYSTYVHDAIRYAWSRGVVLVGAAGNNGRFEPFYPASYPEVISVSATQVEDEFSFWSSYHTDVDVSAPGSSVLTTNCEACKPIEHDTTGDHRYTYISGTSFATPNVAGVVALIWARYPTMTNAQVVERLKTTTDDLGYSGHDSRYGSGRVNAYRALGASVPAPAPSTGDAAEPNNVLAAARWMAIDTTIHPSIHPAGDVDVYAVDMPRAGRLDVRATGVVDSRSYPWHRSVLPVDPILELYNTAGTLLVRVDNQWETGTELASVVVNAPVRILIRVTNYYVNGNTRPYTLTPTYVDIGAPTANVTHPTSGAGGASHYVAPTAVFSEGVTNVTSTTMVLRDTATNLVVPATVSYDGARREARLVPANALQPMRTYRVELSGGITDLAGLALAPTASTFTTGLNHFSDANGTTFAVEIDWLADAGITTGCSRELFCPAGSVTREQMASFLARALGLGPTSTDFFADDEASPHEDDINRIAAVGVTVGCGSGRFCPSQAVPREQMASFLARALGLPSTSSDFFTDDEASVHEGDINRIAAAGVTNGCGGSRYCPQAAVTREQMAAFLYRAFSGS
jgi:serine protease